MTEPYEMSLHWRRRAEWPVRDPNGWLYMGRAILRLGAALYPAQWRDADMLGHAEEFKRYAKARDLIVGWMASGDLLFGARSHTGTIEAEQPHVWAGNLADPDLCRIARVGGWGVHHRPIDVDLVAFERLLADSTRDAEAERTRASIPPSPDENRRKWANLPETLDEAFRRLSDIGQQTASKRAVARTLEVMWGQLGHKGGTEDTFGSYLKEVRDPRFKE